MEKPDCPICQNKHWPRDGHVWDAINKVSKAEEDLKKLIARKDSRRLTGAINESTKADADAKATKLRHERSDAASSRTPNRREKSVYNAYMRMYMALKRQTPKAIAAGLACPVPEKIPA